jgi:outer membrane lipoprotein
MSFRGIKKAVFSVFVPCLLVGFLNGCATVPSRQLRVQAAPISFRAVLQKANAFRGQRVILGGYVLETINEPDRSLLIVLQAPLDFQNRPKSQDLSEGRFVVQTSEFLDPEIFSKDRRVTVGGTVRGTLSRQIGNTAYLYPLIESVELHLWPKEVRYPRRYDPYWPYWRRPWYPCDPFYPCYPWW